MSSKRGSTRLRRTWQALAVLILVGAALAAYNVYTHQTDVRLATGPEGPEQQRFFVEAADRPDAPTLFKNLSKDRKLAFARNIARYDDPAMAKLIGVLLADLDADAREELTKSLTAIAAKQPSAVADELKNAGTFQQLGVFRALQSIGPAALPVVVKRLETAETRPNAVAFLVERGQAAIPPTLAALRSHDKDTRLAAADTLGKLRAAEAAPLLEAQYRSSESDDRLPLLTALASIGRSSSQGLFSDALAGAATPPLRAQGALGLGHVGTAEAAAVLWRYVADPVSVVREATLTGLQLCGDTALRVGIGQPLALRLRVAGGVRSAEADRLIGAALADAQLATEAARIASSRPGLVGQLRASVVKVDPDADGGFIAATVAALDSTAEGRKALDTLHSDVRFRGFIARQRDQDASGRS